MHKAPADPTGRMPYQIQPQSIERRPRLLQQISWISSMPPSGGQHRAVTVASMLVIGGCRPAYAKIAIAQPSKIKESASHDRMNDCHEAAVRRHAWSGTMIRSHGCRDRTFRGIHGNHTNRHRD